MSSRTRLYQLSKPLSPPDLTAHERTLKNLQGNILKSHGRDLAQHVFLTFREGAQDQARHFLTSLVPALTSEAKQRAQTRRFRKTRQSELFLSVYLSAKGYQFLGFSKARFSQEFWHGMAASRLNDPPLSEWEPAFQRNLHAMVILAHNDRRELENQLRQLRSDVRGFTEVTSELGKSMGQPKKVVEHFGYVDGISQPLFYESDLKGTSTEYWDPSAGPKLVLLKDPYGKSSEDCGTYFVFRKLEQNVKGFRKHAEDLAALHANNAEPGLVGAMIIGRFQNGTPLALPNNGVVGAENDFRYSRSDPEGHRCPFFAHIRKTNPRGESGLRDEKSHRIARRGITYGRRTPANAATDSLPETGVGLLFQCCQADLKEQFEFLQRQWANSNSRPKPRAGKDPVIGQSENGSFPHLRFPRAPGETASKPFDFHGYVTMKGGEYFFAPSISFLKKLGES